MKIIRYFQTLLCIAMSAVSSAQVVEFHVNENYHHDGQSHVSKFYLANIDSIVYVPALDWTPTVELIKYYRDEQEQVHAVVHVTTGPDADFARLYFLEHTVSSSYFSYDVDIQNNDTLTDYALLDKGCDMDVDFVVPAPNTIYWVTLVTANHRYYPVNYRTYVTATCKVYAEDFCWKTLGMSLYREDMMASLFGVDNVEYEVEIQEHLTTQGLYRLVNPYGAAYSYNESGDYDTAADHYMIIHAEDPEYVWIELFKSGMNWGYGEVWMNSYVGYRLDSGYSLEQVKENSPESFGKLQDGIITMPEKCMVISMTEYSGGGWMYANRNSLFAIALPGYSLPSTDEESEAKALRPMKAPTMERRSKPRLVPFSLSEKDLVK